MGLYRDQILPRVIDKVLADPAIMRHRAETTAGLSGTIVEIGFGSGLNVPVYPPEVTRVYAVDPALVGRRLAAERVAASPVTVEYVGLDGQDLPLDEATCDGALATFTLCTVPDPDRALAELKRVLKPGGRLHLLEHGLAPEPSVARWQRRLNPVQRRLADGCHLDRDHRRLVEDAGFVIDEHREWYARGPRPWTRFHLLRAHRPG